MYNIPATKVVVLIFIYPSLTTMHCEYGKFKIASLSVKRSILRQYYVIILSKDVKIRLKIYSYIIFKVPGPNLEFEGRVRNLVKRALFYGKEDTF